MLTVPQNIYLPNRSMDVDHSTFVDWLEATLLFGEEDFSKSELVKHLIEQKLFDSQDNAWRFVSGIWSDLKRRVEWLGTNSPIEVGNVYAENKLQDSTWKAIPAHSYCLAVSIGPKYDGWPGQIGGNYTLQGTLFELITKAAMESRFERWHFLHTGWGSGVASNLKELVDRLANAVGEKVNLLDEYGPERANDAGVDLVWHLPFTDGRGGAPIYLAQCASGSHWASKLSEPDLDMWCKIIDFAARPNRAFSVPFALDDRDLRIYSNANNQRLFLDRYRLLAQEKPEADWVPGPLRDTLVGWLEPKVEWITGL